MEYNCGSVCNIDDDDDDDDDDNYDKIKHINIILRFINLIAVIRH